MVRFRRSFSSQVAAAGERRFKVSDQWYDEIRWGLWEGEFAITGIRVDQATVNAPRAISEAGPHGHVEVDGSIGKRG